MEKKYSLERTIAKLGFILSVIYLVAVPFGFCFRDNFLMAGVYSPMSIVCVVANVIGIASHFLKPEQSDKKDYRLISLTPSCLCSDFIFNDQHGLKPI